MGLDDYFRARTSAAKTSGFFVRAFRMVLKMLTSLKLTVLNSSRKAPPSFAPAIQANQLLGFCSSPGRGREMINSAA